MPKKASKRELINTGTDKRYMRRDEKGQFRESDDVGRSLAADRRQRATPDLTVASVALSTRRFGLGVLVCRWSAADLMAAIKSTEIPTIVRQQYAKGIVVGGASGEWRFSRT